MQSFSTQEKISRLISKIQIDWERASGGNHGVSRIDKDILTDDIKKLYELVYELDTVVANRNVQFVEKAPEKVVVEEITEVPQTDIQPEPEPEVAVNEEVLPEEEQPEEQIEVLAKEPVFLTVESEEVIEVLAVEEEKTFSQAPLEVEIDGVEAEVPEVAPIEDEIEIAAPQPNSVENSEPNTKEDLDLFSAAKTLADVYQTDKDNSLAAKIQNNKILDIKTAIGINDKFLFINDIFKGEMSAYNQAIDKLNQTADFSDAIHFIEELKSNYGNEENKTSFIKLFEIAKRKFR